MIERTTKKTLPRYYYLYWPDEASSSSSPTRWLALYSRRCVADLAYVALSRTPNLAAMDPYKALFMVWVSGLLPNQTERNSLVQCGLSLHEFLTV